MAKICFFRRRHVQSALKSIVCCSLIESPRDKKWDDVISNRYIISSKFDLLFNEIPLGSKQVIQRDKGPTLSFILILLQVHWIYMKLRFKFKGKTWWPLTTEFIFLCFLLWISVTPWVACPVVPAKAWREDKNGQLGIWRNDRPCQILFRSR